MNANISQTMLHVHGRYCTQIVDIENAESVIGVKVCTSNSLIFLHFYVFV